MRIHGTHHTNAKGKHTTMLKGNDYVREKTGREIL